MSEGEPLIGSFPDKIARVSRYDSLTKSWRDAFITKGVEGFSTDDPRLGPLPSGWRFKDHEYRHIWNEFEQVDRKHVGNQERSIKSADPRWSFEALARRGLNIQTVTLF